MLQGEGDQHEEAEGEPDDGGCRPAPASGIRFFSRTSTAGERAGCYRVRESSTRKPKASQTTAGAVQLLPCVRLACRGGAACLLTVPRSSAAELPVLFVSRACNRNEWGDVRFAAGASHRKEALLRQARSRSTRPAATGRRRPAAVLGEAVRLRCLERLPGRGVHGCARPGRVGSAAVVSVSHPARAARHPWRAGCHPGGKCPGTCPPACYSTDSDAASMPLARKKASRPRTPKFGWSMKKPCTPRLRSWATSPMMACGASLACRVRNTSSARRV